MAETEAQAEHEETPNTDTSAGDTHSPQHIATPEAGEPTTEQTSDNSASFAALKAEIADVKNAMGEILELVSATKVNESIDHEDGDGLDEWGDTLPGF